MQFSNKVYDFCKYLVEIVLPGLGTLYFSLAQIWGLPFGEEVVGTLVALALFIGVLIGISKSSYNKVSERDGTIEIDASDPNRDVYSINLAIPLEELNERKTVSLNVAQLKPK